MILLGRVARISGVDQGSFRGDRVGIFVVKPDTARTEVAELHRLTSRDGNAYAPHAVAAAYQLVGTRHPVVEGADRRNRSVVNIVGEHELNAGAGAVGLDMQCHGHLLDSQGDWSRGRD